MRCESFDYVENIQGKLKGKASFTPRGFALPIQHLVPVIYLIFIVVCLFLRLFELGGNGVAH